jgi:hypothetical protein
MQAEIERALELEPTKDFSSTTQPTTCNESVLCIEQFCFPLILLGIPKLLGQLVK